MTLEVRRTVPWARLGTRFVLGSMSSDNRPHSRKGVAGQEIPLAQVRSGPDIRGLATGASVPNEWCEKKHEQSCIAFTDSNDPAAENHLHSRQHRMCPGASGISSNFTIGPTLSHATLVAEHVLEYYELLLIKWGKPCFE